MSDRAPHHARAFGMKYRCAFCHMVFNKPSEQMQSDCPGKPPVKGTT